MTATIRKRIRQARTARRALLALALAPAVLLAGVAVLMPTLDDDAGLISRDILPNAADNTRLIGQGIVTKAQEQFISAIKARPPRGFVAKGDYYAGCHLTEGECI